MRNISVHHLGLLAVAFIPSAVLAAAGGTADGFGAEDWLARWPVLAVVLGLVVGTTSYFVRRIVQNARKLEQ